MAIQGCGMSQATKKKAEAVIIRRGGALLGKLPAQKVPILIQKKKLFPSDRLSADGKIWVRLDKHGQLKKYFNDQVAVPVLASRHKGCLLADGQVMAAPATDLRVIFLGIIILTGITVYFTYFYH